METRTTLPSMFQRAGTSLGSHMMDLQRQIDRLFDDFSGRWAAAPMTDATYWPPLEMVETSDAVDITAELPGIDPKDVDISVSGDILTIKGEKKAERQVKDRDYFCAERSYGAFSRSLELPFELDSAKVDASYEKGVLRLHIAKPAGARKETRKIAIKAA